MKAKRASSKPPKLTAKPKGVRREKPPQNKKQLNDLKADLDAVEKLHTTGAGKKAAKIDEPILEPNQSANEDNLAEVQRQEDGLDIALAVVENRHPITLTFEMMIQQGLASHELQAQWTFDMTQAVIEGAKKFVGFHNVNSLRKALDINLGLLSLALLIRTDGKHDIDTWAGILQKTPLTDLLKETLSHIKTLAYEQKEFLFLELEERPLRETLLTIATARDRRRKSVWSGYSQFLQEKRNRATVHTTDQLGRFLIECLLRKSPKAWIEQKINRQGSKNDEPNIPLAEEVINTLILRYCTLKLGEHIPENIDLQTSYISRLRTEYEAKPQAWLASASSRFDQLLKLLSPEMKEHLREKNWFAIHLKDGPPKPIKAPKRKKSKSDDDLAPPEFIDIAGISGIYCYNIYG